MTNITLRGTQAVQLQSNYGMGFTLQNNGPGKVYLDNYPSVTPSSSWRLTQGMSIPVSDGTQLWACTDAGVTADVQTLLGVQAQAATIISGSVNIAGGTVTLSGPVTISGGVSVTGSTINVGNPIQLTNNLTLLTSIPLAFALGNTAIPAQGLIDVSAYASVIIRINSVAAGVNNAAVGNYIRMFLEMCDSAGVASNYYTPQFLACTSGVSQPQSIQIPVTSTKLFINIVTTFAAIANAGTYTFNIYGSGQAITKPRYVSQGDGLLGSVPQGGFFQGTSIVAGSASFFVASINDTASVITANAGGSVVSGNRNELAYCQDGALAFMFGRQEPTNVGDSVVDTMILAMRPLVARITLSGATSGVQVSVMQ